MAPDLDEHGIGLELDGTQPRLVNAAGKHVDDLMTSVVAFGEGIGYESTVPMPYYASARFRTWYAGTQLTGLELEPALGGGDQILSVRVKNTARAAKGDVDRTTWDGSSFFYVNGPGMLYCDAAAAQALEAAGFAFSVEPAAELLAALSKTKK